MLEQKMLSKQKMEAEREVMSEVTLIGLDV